MHVQILLDTTTASHDTKQSPFWVSLPTLSLSLCFGVSRTFASPLLGSSDSCITAPIWSSVTGRANPISFLTSSCLCWYALVLAAGKLHDGFRNLLFHCSTWPLTSTTYDLSDSLSNTFHGFFESCNISYTNTGFPSSNYGWHWLDLFVLAHFPACVYLYSTHHPVLLGVFSVPGTSG